MVSRLLVEQPVYADVGTLTVMLVCNSCWIVTVVVCVYIIIIIDL